MTSPDPAWQSRAAPQRRQDWRNRAACKGKLHLFYPSGSGHPHDAEAAKELCRQCPVARSCLDDVMVDRADSYEGTGIRAGLTAAERRALHRIREDHRRLQIRQRREAS